jgi:hypothetical protein
MGNESWTKTKTNERGKILAEMSFMRRTVECPLPDHQRNEEIMRELQFPQTTELIEKYKIN